MNDWSAICWADGEIYKAKDYKGLEIMDRAGGGDSFASGLIYGLMTTENAENGCLGTNCPQAAVFLFLNQRMVFVIFSCEIQKSLHIITDIFSFFPNHTDFNKERRF